MERNVLVAEGLSVALRSAIWRTKSLPDDPAIDRLGNPRKPVDNEATMDAAYVRSHRNTGSDA